MEKIEFEEIEFNQEVGSLACGVACGLACTAFGGATLVALAIEQV